jgi:hypothetical protein
VITGKQGFPVRYEPSMNPASVKTDPQIKEDIQPLCVRIIVVQATILTHRDGWA